MENFEIVNPSLRIIDFEGFLTVSIFCEAEDLSLRNLDKELFFESLKDISIELSAATYCIGLDPASDMNERFMTDGIEGELDLLDYLSS